MPKKKKIKILLVEDDAFLIEMYNTKFELEKFEVLTAVNGDDGVKMVIKEMPDLVLLDILLPKLDGFGVLEQLKSNQKTKNIPIILLTNLGQKEDVKKGLELGASDYLIKAHFMPSEVVKKIREVLN